MHFVLEKLLKYYPFIIGTATFFVMAAYFYVLSVGSGARSIRGLIGYALPFDKWISRSSRMDIITNVIEKFTGTLNFAAGAAITTLAVAWIGSKFHYAAFAHLHSSILVMILVSVFIFIFVDFADYLTHYLQHFVPALWELHKTHHSATYLTPFTARRVHPLGELFEMVTMAIFIIVPLSICQIMFHFSITELFVMLGAANSVSALLMFDSLRHSHLPVSFGPLQAVLTSPHMHQLHHSSKIEHWDKNFGHKLSIWDWWFGTMLVPRKGEAFVWGLGRAEEEEYNSLFGAFVGPLVKIGKLVGGKPMPDYKGGLIAQDPSFFRRVLWRSPSDIRAKQLMLSLTASAPADHDGGEIIDPAGRSPQGPALQAS